MSGDPLICNRKESQREDMTQHTNLMCANYCGTALQRDEGEWDFYCPTCQTPERMARMAPAMAKAATKYSKIVEY